MKQRKKFYHHNPWPQDPEGWQTPEFKGTFMEVLLILLIGLLAGLYLVYQYYVRTSPKPDPPKPVEVPQEGSTRNADLTEGRIAHIGAATQQASEYPVIQVTHAKGVRLYDREKNFPKRR